MNLKALVIVIIFLSSLVVLLLLNFNRPAMAPIISPSQSARGTAAPPTMSATLSAKINISNASEPVNATAFPSIEPVAQVTYPPPAAPKPSASPQPSPSESIEMRPWQAMPA